MIRFIENIIFLLLVFGMFGFGALVYYYRCHDIENHVTTAAYLIGWCMLPVSFFVQKK